MKNIDKSKFVLVRDAEEFIQDQPLETKEIGYYRDSWNRFKKNKASLVAFGIIVIIFFFVLVGPYMKDYNVAEIGDMNAGRLQFLPPKIPGLEKIGIFDGTSSVTRGKRFLHHMANSEFGEGIILEGFPQEVIDDVNHPDYANVSQFTVKVDHYKYQNYIMSYMPVDYYTILDNNAATGANVDPYGACKRAISQEQYDEWLSKNYLIDVLSINETVASDGTVTLSYDVRADQFLVSLDQLPEDTYFWFGTTERGQDLFTEIWKGARISIIMAVTVLVINTVVGLIIGAVVGYYGGVLDLVFDRFVDIIAAIPFMAVLMLLTLQFGNDLWVIVVAFTATGWLGSYGTGRMQFYRFKNREYVLAARTLGASDARIMFKHIFPNTLGLIVTGYALAIPSFVFTEASYSFLGIIKYGGGVQGVGMLIDTGQQLMQRYPHLLLFPALYISILMIVFNLFGNGLRDAFNPSLRGAE